MLIAQGKSIGVKYLKHNILSCHLSFEITTRRVDREKSFQTLLFSFINLNVIGKQSSKLKLNAIFLNQSNEKSP